MFQNINIEAEEIEENQNERKIDKKQILKENFKIQNIILYILAFGVARNRLWRWNHAICTSILGSSM